MDENGQVVLEGLDEALKFVRLKSDWTPPEGEKFADVIEKVVAYYTDGTTQEYAITEANSGGNISVTFDESRICNGYDIVFRDDYAMQAGESVRFYAYTVYRDPVNTHIPDGADKITYRNAARSINSYQRGEETVYVYLRSQYSCDMLPSTENLSVEKRTFVNDGTETWMGLGGNTVGKTYVYVIHLTGSLLEPEVKQYEDLRAVDLLPDGVHYDKIYLVQQGNTGGPILDGGKNYQPEIFENYHNSGRTAVIFHLNAENLKKSLDVHTTYAEFQLRDQAGNLIAAAVSDEQGLLRFRDLTEGTYTLTETKVPACYMDKNLSLAVTITQNPVTMDYSFAFSSGFTGAGTGADPLRVPNSTTYILPETGGSGTAGFYALGVSLLLLAAFLPVRGRRKN